MQIMLATDFSEPAAEASRVALEYARRFGARLHVLHVVLPVTDAVAPSRLERMAREIAPSVPVITAVRSGVPAAEIVRYAAAEGIDLIVVGTHGRTGLSRALIGSVTERVVRTAPCPVLSVPRAQPDVPPAEGVDTEPAPHRCIVCGQPSEELVCEGCRARIRGELIDRKQRDERAGRA